MISQYGYGRYIDAHSTRVAAISMALAADLQLTPSERGLLRVAGYLHDVGKAIIPGPILHKAGPLTVGEFAIIKQHSAAGAVMLENMRGQMWAVVREAVLHHHERLDGSGYPEGLSGESISLYARILAVADVYDALTSRRPYRPPMTHEQTAQVLQQEAARGRLDPDLVGRLMRLTPLEIRPPRPSSRWRPVPIGT